MQDTNYLSFPFLKMARNRTAAHQQHTDDDEEDMNLVDAMEKRSQYIADDYATIGNSTMESRLKL